MSVRHPRAPSVVMIATLHGTWEIPLASDVGQWLETACISPVQP